MKTIIHVNQHNIKHNKKTGDDKPVITCKTYKTNTYAHDVSILGKDGAVIAKVVYRPEKPLSCGATVWIETDCDVVCDPKADVKELTVKERAAEIMHKKSQIRKVKVDPAMYDDVYFLGLEALCDIEPPEDT